MGGGGGGVYGNPLANMLAPGYQGNSNDILSYLGINQPQMGNQKAPYAGGGGQGSYDQWMRPDIKTTPWAQSQYNPANNKQFATEPGGVPPQMGGWGSPSGQMQNLPAKQKSPYQVLPSGVMQNLPAAQQQPGSDFFSQPQPGWQNYYPASQFPLKKPGVAADPNTDWYGYPAEGPGQQIKFAPPPWVKGGQPYKML